ncbi:hypothetical protein B0H13DRAFT_2660862 [Mycena leptocephala]|nr:hypothetical protein B0H13DRAFT_2660862 [Mycena leptocephala]
MARDLWAWGFESKKKAAIPVASGSSLPIHPYYRDAGFQPGATKGKEKYTYKDHRVTNEHVNGLLVAGTNLRERIDYISSDVSQSSLPYKCRSRTQQHCQQRSGTFSDLWTSHYQHGENIRQHGITITNISARLLPALLRRIEQLHGSVNKFTSVVDTLAFAAVALAPLAKRTRDENVDAARNTGLRTEVSQTVALSTTFVYTPPPLGPPVAVSAPPVATTMPFPVTTASPAPPLPPSAPAQAPPAAPSALPCAPALGPPALLWNLLPHLVVFGLITWNRDSQNPTNVRRDLLAIVFPATAHLGISFTHRYKKLNTCTAVAAAPEIANWVVDSWDHAARYKYAGIYAVHPNA